MSITIKIIIILLSFNNIILIDFSPFYQDVFIIACQSIIPKIPSDCFKHRQIGNRCCYSPSQGSAVSYERCNSFSENTLADSNWFIKYNLTCPNKTESVTEPLAGRDAGLQACNDSVSKTREDCLKIKPNLAQCCYSNYTLTCIPLSINYITWMNSILNSH